MKENKNHNIKVNEELLKKLVYSIKKAVGEDQREYLRENHHETNNALTFLRGDNINTNLKKYVENDDIHLITFDRHIWSGIIIDDTKEQKTYSIISERTLSKVSKNRNKVNPHYLHSILHMENKGCVAKQIQMSFNNSEYNHFNENTLKKDFETVTQGLIDTTKDYRHYIISYEVERGELSKVSLNLLDECFNEVNMIHLEKYIGVGFEWLTDIDPIEEAEEDKKENKRELVSIKKGIKPKLHDIDETKKA